MSRPQAKKAGRIADLRSTVVDRIEAELGGCMRRVAEVVEQIRQVREIWQAAVSEAEAPVCSSGDLAQAHDYRIALSRKIEMLSVEERKARGEEEACRQRLCAAKSDLKKIEMWRDRLLDAAVAEEHKDDRKATDEVAARVARSV